MSLLLPLTAAATGADAAVAFRFDFGPGRVAPGHTQVLASTAYTGERGFGFDLGSAVSCVEHDGTDAVPSDLCAGERAFYFSITVPQGNYRVSVTLAGTAGGSVTTVEAESRRLMLEKLVIAAGACEIRRFTVNVRNSRIATDGEVELNERERGALHWDDKLTLAFRGTRPAVAVLEVERVENAVTVYLAGDSTVTDQTREPWAAWGQMLPRFFGPDVAIANHAESGETLKAFRDEGRLAKVMSQIRAGDYLFVQFAHNDQKPGPNHLEPFTTYKEQLRLVIDETRRHGATPVLVTPMPRRRFDAEGTIVNTLGDYPEAMRQTAKEEGVALVDLFAAAKTLFEALGPDTSRRAFVHYPARTFPGQDEELKDDTHSSAYGAYELARAVVAAIRSSGLALATAIVAGGEPFDPAHPDPVDGWGQTRE